MVFSSLSFIFIFLAICIALYFALPGRSLKNAVLLIASLIFYSWGEPRLVVLMMFVALVAYIGGICTESLRCSGKTKTRLAVQIVTIVLITSNLLVFKYLNFFVDNICSLFDITSALPEISLPIGISFYTFQILSYIFDLYRGEVKLQKNYFRLLLYLCFFPQLIAGPIVRYSTVEYEIANRKENVDDISSGTKRFIIGLAKKVIIANGVAVVAETIYSGDPSVYGTSMYWLAAFCYTLQIYYDFSGYSDMAIGLGKIFGFHFLENFDYPYISSSVTEFWRRWHISLSTWFRDYIYIPLGGNRVSKPRMILNILVVWAMTGFWHGASWNFMLWGLYYGILLIIEKYLLAGVIKKLPKLLGWIYTMFIVICGWVLFNLTDFNTLARAFAHMFSYHPTSYMQVYSSAADVATKLMYLIPGIIFMFPVCKNLKDINDKPILNVLSWIIHLGLFALCMVYLFSSHYNPFIYFRF